MKKEMIFVGLMAVCAMVPDICAAGQDAPGGELPVSMPLDTWEVNIRQMPDTTRVKITETMSRLKGNDEDRGLINDISKAVGLGAVSGVVDAMVSETYNLYRYRDRQKQEWMRMIQNENNYTDSITSIKTLRDFYSANSSKGALDPSDINFDGIEIRGMRNGQEVLYMSCSIDRGRIDNIFRHSKFNLVLDTLAFYPYQCHLPNVTANGIRIMNDVKKGRAQVNGDTIVRPGKGGNGFSFDERNNLMIGVDFALYSSWINEAVQVHRDVELGNFTFTIAIPDSVGKYEYSRLGVLGEAADIDDEQQRNVFLYSNLLAVDGDCFVVPRSYMPLDNGKPMWGTGEYNIKVRLRESCQLDNDSDKARHWKEDYKRLRQMQKKSGEVQEYLQTLWNQYGNSLVKASYKTALSTTATKLTAPLLGSGSAMSGAAAGAAAGNASGAAAPSN